MTDRGTGTESEAGADRQRRILSDPVLVLEDLARLLVRSAARENFEASQAEKDEDTNDQKS